MNTVKGTVLETKDGTLRVKIVGFGECGTREDGMLIRTVKYAEVEPSKVGARGGKLKQRRLVDGGITGELPEDDFFLRFTRWIRY